MNTDILIRTIGNIDDRYVLEYTAGTVSGRRRSVIPFFKWSMVACAAAILLFVLLPPMAEQPYGTDNPPVTASTQKGSPTSSQPPTNTHDIHFNTVTEFVQGGQRLVNTVHVTAEEFCAVYPLSLSAYLKDHDYHARYILEYHREPIPSDPSRLSNGKITLTDGQNAAFHIIVSESGFVSDLSYCNVSDKKVSRIGNCDVLLLQGALNLRNDCVYGEFQLGDLYVICYTYDKFPSELIDIIRSMIENAQ